MWKSRISFRTFKCQKYIKYKFCHFVFLHNLKVCVLLMFIVWRDLKLKCRLLEWMITDQSELFSLFVTYFVQEQALQQFIHYPVTKSGFTYRTKTFSNPPNPVIVPFGILSVIKKTYLTALTKGGMSEIGAVKILALPKRGGGWPMPRFFGGFVEVSQKPYSGITQPK